MQENFHHFWRDITHVQSIVESSPNEILVGFSTLLDVDVVKYHLLTTFAHQ